jgi:hypothetical protein
MSNLRGRPFQPGNNLGRGRPKGSRNREKSAVQNLLDEHSLHIVRKTLAMALAGNPTALKLAVERLIPTRRESYTSIKLPLIRTARDVGVAAERVTKAVAQGKLTPVEGETIMRILEMHARVIETGVIEARLDSLEKAVENDSSRES